MFLEIILLYKRKIKGKIQELLLKQGWWCWLTNKNAWGPLLLFYISELHIIGELFSSLFVFPIARA